MAGRWRMEACEGALAGQAQVEDLLDLPLLQRLAQQRAQEIQIQETNDTFDFSQVCGLGVIDDSCCQAPGPLAMCEIQTSLSEVYSPVRRLQPLICVVLLLDT